MTQLDSAKESWCPLMHRGMHPRASRHLEWKHLDGTVWQHPAYFSTLSALDDCNPALGWGGLGEKGRGGGGRGGGTSVHHRAWVIERVHHAERSESIHFESWHLARKTPLTEIANWS